MAVTEPEFITFRKAPCAFPEVRPSGQKHKRFLDSVVQAARVAGILYRRSTVEIPFAGSDPTTGIFCAVGGMTTEGNE